MSNSNNSLHFVDVGRGVWIAEVPIRYASGRLYNAALRIDTRGPRVRLDVWDVAVWEAADGDVGFASLDEAKAYAASWVAAARAQSTLHPRVR